MKNFLLASIALLFVSGTFLKSAEIADTAIVASDGKHKLSISIPNNYDKSKAYSLVLAIHPCMAASYKSYLTALAPLTDSLNMIVAVPDNSATGGWIADENMDILTVCIDSLKAMYNIDAESVYLTGMSCGGQVAARQGLNKLYPFKAVFSWVPYIPSINAKLFDFNSDMPITVAVGTSDDYLTSTLAFYDSLKAHKANVNLLLVPGIAHTYNFNNFGNEMIHSIQYLHDNNAISIEFLNEEKYNIEILNNAGPTELEFKVENKNANKMEFSALSSHKSIVDNPEVTYNETNGTAKLKFEPIEGKSGKVTLVMEVKEKGGTAIEQVTLRVKVSKAPVVIQNSNLNTQLQVYPSPASNMLYLNCHEPKLVFQIYDINGRIVLNSATSNKSIDISILSSGVYFLTAKGYTPVQFLVK